MIKIPKNQDNRAADTKGRNVNRIISVNAQGAAQCSADPAVGGMGPLTFFKSDPGGTVV